MELFHPASRMAGDCRPTRAAVEVSGTGRSDWRWHETIQGRAENAGSKATQAGIGNAKQSVLHLWAFLGLCGDFNRNSGKTGLFAPAFAPSRRSARDGGLGGSGGNRGESCRKAGFRGLLLRGCVRLGVSSVGQALPVCGGPAHSQRL